MNLINIQQMVIAGNKINSVDARELHATLGVKKAFTTWIKTNLDAMGAIEDEDYMQFKNSLEGSGYKKVFILTTNTAKHIAMMSKLPKGKEVRDYFIKVEEESKSTALMSPNQITEALALTAQSLTLQDERLDSQHERIQEVEIQTNSQDERLIQLENNVRLTNQQEYELIQTHHKKVYELAKLYGKDSEDKALHRKLHSKVWSIFKKRFMLPRFNELRAIEFEVGINFLNKIALKDI